jgi:hypothetical protein
MDEKRKRPSLFRVAPCANLDDSNLCSPVVLSSRHFNQSLGIVVRAVVPNIHSFNQSRERTLRKH